MKQKWPHEKPSPTIVTTRPAGTLFFGARLNDVRWVMRTNRDGRKDGTRQAVPVSEPSPTITGLVGTQVEFAPDDGGGNRTSAKQGDGVRITMEEALILQDFPSDYPVQGLRTRAFLQVGNAIPPGLAFAALSMLIGDD